jgi:hypothetical protein
MDVQKSCLAAETGVALVEGGSGWTKKTGKEVELKWPEYYQSERASRWTYRKISEECCSG